MIFCITGDVYADYLTDIYNNIARWDTKRIDDILELDEVVGNGGWVESLRTLWIKTVALEILVFGEEVMHPVLAWCLASQLSCLLSYLHNV